MKAKIATVLVIAVAALSVGGCLALKRAHKPKLVPLPPLPWDKHALVLEAPAVPDTVSQRTLPGLTNIIFRWQNAPWPWAAGWVTRIDGTTNLTDYYEITNVPYVTNGTAILSNRPAKTEFYRVRNGLLMEKEWE